MAQIDIDYEEIVGFENEAEKIIHYLIGGTNELDVVPIVCMGEQGKMTISGKVYDNESIVSRFDDRAWCIISQTYNRRELLHRLDFCSLSGLELPSNLKKLLLIGTPIESEMSFIAGLPNLEYLQLEEPLFIEVHTRDWCLGDITFLKLKFLKLVKLRISRWDASKESFPLLETLVINKCGELEEIPLSFADIPTLKHIKLIECGKESLEASAVKIMEDIEENEGCNRISVFIYKSSWV